jgi:hypothetical protein
MFAMHHWAKVADWFLVSAYKDMSLLASCLVCKVCVALGPAFLPIDACVLELAWKQKFNEFAPFSFSVRGTQGGTCSCYFL